MAKSGADGVKLLSNDYVKHRLAAPHTWQAAEVLLYLLEPKRVKPQ